jgi:high-affinity Fe2+/Pb2+ permease
LLGMLMIPKTIMYIAIAGLAYYGLWLKPARKKHKRQTA